MFKKIAVVAAAATVLVACDTTSSMPYQASAQNVIVAQQALRSEGAQVSVGGFTAAEGVDKPMCRLMGQLDIAPGKDVATFVRDAFEAELFQTGELSTDAPAITGQVESLDVNTVGSGSWTITLSVASPSLPAGYSVTTTHEFASSYSAYAACQNAAMAFNPAVQALLNDVVSDPRFGELVN